MPDFGFEIHRNGETIRNCRPFVTEHYETVSFRTRHLDGEIAVKMTPVDDAHACVRAGSDRQTQHSKFKNQTIANLLSVG